MQGKEARGTGLPAWLDGQTIAIVGTVLTVAVGISTLVLVSTAGIRADMATQIGGLRAEMGGLRAEMRDVRAENGGLRAEMGGLRAEMRDVRAENGGLRSEMGGLRTDMGGLRAEMGGLRAEMNDMRKALTARLDALDDRLRNLEQTALVIKLNVGGLEKRVVDVEAHVRESLETAHVMRRPDG